MLLHTGHGWLVPAVSFGCCLVMEFGLEWLTGDDQFYQKHRWPAPAALSAAAVVLAAVAPFVREKRPAWRGRLATDEPAVRPGPDFENTFFFVPFGWWPPVVLAAAVLLAVR